MAPKINVVKARVNIRSKVFLLTKIRDALKDRGDNSYNMFKRTVFGPWLDVRTDDHDSHVLNYLLFHQRNVTNPTFDSPFIFDIGKHTIEMGRREFCLITGFRFGDIYLGHLTNVSSNFMKRVFPKLRSLKGENLLSLLEDKEFNDLSEPDAVRVCLLLAADYCFMGQEPRHVMAKEIVALVDDLDEWNAFPWGEHMWLEFHDRNYMLVSEKRDDYMEAYAREGSSYKAVYNLYGFVFALKILILESFPQSKMWWDKIDNALPRGIAWGDLKLFKKSEYNKLFHATTPPQIIVPTAVEKESLYWSSSLEYFDNPCVSFSRENKCVKRDKIRYRLCHNINRKTIATTVRVRTEVHTSVVVDVYSQDDDTSDVAVDESLTRMSNKELLKYVVSLEGRLAVVEKLVKPGKLPTDVNEFDAVPTDKIVIEPSGDVENPKSSVKEPEDVGVEEPMEEDATKEPMEEDAVKEHMEEDAVKSPMEEDAVKAPIVEDSVKEAIEEDELTDFNFFSSLPDNMFQDTQVDDSIDVQQDLGPILDNSWNNEVEAEPCLSPIPSVKVIEAVEAEPCLSPIPSVKVIDVDMHMGDVKTSKVPFLRDRKKGRQLCDPYIPPPPTTPRRSKRGRPSSIWA